MKKNVLITGAAGNLGKSVVEQFLYSGYKVYATTLPGTTLGYNSSGNIETIEVNLDDEAHVRQQLGKTLTSIETLDAALLLAGGYSPGTIESTHGKDIDGAININFKTAFFTSQLIFQKMMAQPGGGRIVLVGARAALRASDGKHSLAYVLSKSMVFKLAEILNAAGAEKNVVTSVIVPSTLDTPANRKAMPQADYTTWVKTEEVAEVMANLVSEKAQALRDPVIKMYGRA